MLTDPNLIFIKLLFFLKTLIIARFVRSFAANCSKTLRVLDLFNTLIHHVSFKLFADFQKWIIERTVPFSSSAVELVLIEFSNENAASVEIEKYSFTLCHVVNKIADIIMALGEYQPTPSVFNSFQEIAKISTSSLSGFMPKACLRAFEILAFIGGGKILPLKLESVASLSLNSFVREQSACICRGVLINSLIQLIQGLFLVISIGFTIFRLLPEKLIRGVKIYFGIIWLI